MNYLAHLYIAHEVGADLSGAILGDFVRGPDLSRFPTAVAASIRLHRRIDTLTDQHALTLGAIGRFDVGPRRYAPVILDVLMDHVLARQWTQYSRRSLPSFCREAARAVGDAAPWFETSRKPTRTGFYALLRSYANEAGIDFALYRIAHRLKRPDPMIEAMRGWQTHIPALTAELPILMSDLVSASRLFLSDHAAAQPDHTGQTK
jgi:acyl carrier protein phosphodiesterase